MVHVSLGDANIPKQTLISRSGRAENELTEMNLTSKGRYLLLGSVCCREGSVGGFHSLSAF